MRAGRAGARLAAVMALAASFCGSARAADPLGRFAADPALVSVSGISSGAYMANQLHVAHSAGIMGAGLVAGGLYGCAVDSIEGDGLLALASLAVGPCMSVTGLLGTAESYAHLVAELARKGWIDPPANLARSHVYVFTGQSDTVVYSKVVEVGVEVYRRLGVPASQIDFHDDDLPGKGAGHSWVTNKFGNACAANATPFIDDCNYDQAGEILQTIYGALQPPASVPAGRILAFDQTEFVAGGAAAANGLADTGYMYLPKVCEAGAGPPCRLHVALHGCLQAAERLGDIFYTKIGLNEWADTNGIIVLYPQAHATTVSELSSQNILSVLNTNLDGCWNWYGYANDMQFATKRGTQIGAIWAMVQRVTGRD